MDFHLNERDRAEGLHNSLSVLSGTFFSYSSAVISFASVGRHFPKNMALQSEKPNR
jgi:hypothetical protein